MKKRYMLKRDLILSLAGEAERVEQVKAVGLVPAECGPDIPAAPARGAFKTFAPTQIKVGTSGTLENAGYRGPGEATFRRAIQVLDVWDVMEAPILRQHQAFCAALTATAPDARLPRYQPIFPSELVATARLYRELTERVACSGMRGCLASVLDSAGGVGGAGGVSEAMLASASRLADIHRRIGTGIALEPARGRKPIMARWLIDAVALQQMLPEQVLRARGWVSNGRQREAVRGALRQILDLMLSTNTARVA